MPQPTTGESVRARVNLALSILTHADPEHLERAAAEAMLALAGTSLSELLAARGGA